MPTTLKIACPAHQRPAPNKCAHLTRMTANMAFQEADLQQVVPQVLALVPEADLQRANSLLALLVDLGLLKVHRQGELAAARSQHFPKSFPLKLWGYLQPHLSQQQ
mmetsp:Transcript_51143/g.121545  ORF Transcript_51143/g.121545 Transcript_51143/m.121545 type:complete len:106 (+) Transcript_51143:33-350(+)